MGERGVRLLTYFLYYPVRNNVFSNKQETRGRGAPGLGSRFVDICNWRRWGGQILVVIENEWESLKWNVKYWDMINEIVGLYFFTDKSITVSIQQDMLKLYVIPQLQDIPHTIFQLPHWSLNVRNCLDQHFPERWMFTRWNDRMMASSFSRSNTLQFLRVRFHKGQGLSN